MRNISFTETKPQFRARQKHRTRRGNAKGPTWKNLKPGDVLMGCEQCQGLGKGGKIVRMGPIVILETNIEPLDDIIRRPVRLLRSGSPATWSKFQKTCEFFRNDRRMMCPQGCVSYLKMGNCCDEVSCPGFREVTLEGFPDLTEQQFVDMFCHMNDCEPETEINNILFDYL